MRRFVDKSLLPACGLLLLLADLAPDLASIGTPGLGRSQILFALFAVALCVVSLFIDTRPWSYVSSRVPQLGRKLTISAVAFVVGFAACDAWLQALTSPCHQATEFGWSLEPNHEKQATIHDSPGKDRRVTVRYFENGFKRWHEPDDGQKTLLVVGDSMTEMAYVSNGEEWYAGIEDRFPSLNVVVFGAGGYGSLQEFLVLDKYHDQIRPDYLLWQFCTNDYANNLYELDAMSYPYNNFAIRPYLEHDQVVFRLPLPLASLRRFSFATDRLLRLYDEKRRVNATADLEHFIAGRHRDRERWSEPKRLEMDRLNRDALNVTLRVMARVRERVADTPVFLFNACGPLTENEQTVCDALDFECIDRVYERTLEQERPDEPLRVINNGHWNRRGNEVLGRLLADDLEGRFGALTANTVAPAHSR